MGKKTNLKAWVVILVLLGGILCATASGGVIYVDANAPPGGNGQTWATAYNYLQDALADANSNPDVNEIWVAAGIYTPDSNSAIPDGTGDREATFQLINGTALYGGFPSGGGAWEERDSNAYETILSGDVNGNDVGDANRGENSYHVVMSIDNEETTLLDGFTITGGNAYSNPHLEGGGVYLLNSRVRIMNCVISSNKAYRGGGIRCRGGNSTMSRCTVIGNVAGTKNSWNSLGGGIFCPGSSLAVTECIIKENLALGEDAEGGGIYGCTGPISNCTITGNWVGDLGGGLSNCTGPITNCTISDNVAARDTGGLCRCDGPIINCIISGNVAIKEDTGALGLCGDVINCVIKGNSAGRDAGAMGMGGGRVINCIISGNRAGWDGGAFRRFDGVITNCTIFGNFAGRRGAAMRRCDATISNCIIYGNESGDSSVISLSSVPQYSCVQGGSNGPGCIDADPCLVQPGYWADVNDPNITVEPNDPNAVWVEGDYRLLPSSPCIDAGDNNSVPADTADLDGDGNTAEPIPWDLDGNPRIVDGNDDGRSVVDMGAYEAPMPPIEVPMKFTPQVLNLGSKGKWVKAHCVLPEGYIVEDVDVNTPATLKLLGVSIESGYIDVFVNEDDFVEVEIAFERGAFCGVGTNDEFTEAIVTGSLTSGRCFRGTDTIKIVNNKFKCVAVFASHWLEEECSKSDWCEGADLNEDSVVDLVDFAMLSGCCIEIATQ